MLLKTVLYLHQDTIPITMIHFEISVEYQAIADFNDKYLLVDPMATGQSIIAVLKLMERRAKIHIAVVIPEGIAHPEKHLPDTCHLVASDDKLDERSYIVPGLGDAGDLSYGTKL
jgi:uracil phosphoribosyltransferase